MKVKSVLPVVVFFVMIISGASSSIACGLFASNCDCVAVETGGCASVCGPVGHAAEALLAIPRRILGSLSPGYNACCTQDCCGYVRYPRGCAFNHCPGTAADVAPSRNVTMNANIRVGMPAYVTYGIVGVPAPSRPIPPVVSFNGPLSFDQGPYR